MRGSQFDTSTLAVDGRIVPWLAADGPLSYAPEQPPDRDYYFQYSWILPQVFADGINLRRHYYFGAYSRDECRDLFAFWEAARQRPPTRIAISFGTVCTDAVTTPIAVYLVPEQARWRGRPTYLFVQHGSYQIVDTEDQPLLESGEIVLYRGIGEAERFQFLQGNAGMPDDSIWKRYVQVHGELLSDSVRSFNSIHDRAKRCETGHIRDNTWMSDDIARRHGLDVEEGGSAHALWRAAHQSFSLVRHMAQYKFGPNYVVCKTPLDNIRLTTFFAGEREVRVVAPQRVILLEAHGCRIA